MKLTVILCTYNRGQLLAKALESVAASTVPPSVEWEVLVVDNNSRDQTREIVRDFCGRYPGRFRYLFEPEQGKSYALNSGIREAQGDVLAFMDDDATVEATWLRNLTGALHNGKWGGAGGRIVLQWPSSLPGWVSVEGPLARHGFPGFDQGPEAKELIGPPFGANMAFRKEMFEKHGAFRADLGPNPGSEIRSEDTEFGRRVIAAGEHLRYEPSAVVYHPVPEERINKKHFLKWWFDHGRATAREFQVRPVREFCSLAAWTLRWMVEFEPRARFFDKLVVWEKFGKLVECYRQLLDRTRRKGGTKKGPQEN
jgi:glycosyltransferase involved in cell wall biosynthesis